MKNSIALPLILGLVLAGCASTHTDSDQLSSTNQPSGRQPPIATDQTAEARAATIQKVDAERQAAAAAPAPEASKDAVATSIAPTNSAAATATPATPQSTPPATMTIPASTGAHTPTPLAPAPTEVATAITDPSLSISDRIAQWKLTPAEIKTELEQSGRVLRLKAPAPGEPTGPMDSTLLTQIDSKLKADAETSALALKVEVDTGVVTLSGSARNPEQIGRAIAIALDTGGVTQTISLIKLDAAAQP